MNVSLGPVATIIIATVGFIQVGSSFAQSRADEILRDMDELQRRQKSEASTVEMRLFDASREVRRRTMKVFSHIDEDGRTSALIEFTEPPDIRGLRVLTVQTDDGDDQRIYLPALRRIQRIAGSARDESFAGSDLTYEDLRVRTPDDYLSRMIDSSASSWVIELVPKDDESPYSRIVAEIDKEKLVIVRAQYFDRKERPRKIFSATDFQLYDDGVWRAMQVKMQDVRTNRSTRILYEERNLDRTIDADIFSDRYLRRGVQ